MRCRADKYVGGAPRRDVDLYRSTGRRPLDVHDVVGARRHLDLDVYEGVLDVDVVVASTGGDDHLRDVIWSEQGRFAAKHYRERAVWSRVDNNAVVRA